MKLKLYDTPHSYQDNETIHTMIINTFIHIKFVQVIQVLLILLLSAHDLHQHSQPGASGEGEDLNWPSYSQRFHCECHCRCQMQCQNVSRMAMLGLAASKQVIKLSANYFILDPAGQAPTARFHNPRWLTMHNKQTAAAIQQVRQILWKGVDILGWNLPSRAFSSLFIWLKEYLKSLVFKKCNVTLLLEGFDPTWKKP